LCWYDTNAFKYVRPRARSGQCNGAAKSRNKNSLKFEGDKALDRKNGFVTATKLGTTDKIFVAATKSFAATKCFLDRTKYFVVVTKCFCYPYFNK